MNQNVFEDGYVSSEEAKQITKEVGELPLEVLDDIHHATLNVLGSYYDHANYANRMVARFGEFADDLPLYNGMTPVAMRKMYLTNIKELEEVLSLLGIVKRGDDYRGRLKLDVFKDGEVTSAEANQVAKEISDLSQQVLDDIRASLLEVLESYYARATLANAEKNNEERYKYLQYIKEFEDVLVIMGVLRQQDRDTGRFNLNFTIHEQPYEEPITDF